MINQVESIECRVRKIVLENTVLTMQDENVSRGTRLVEDLGMDSMQIINLFAQLEFT